MKEHTKKEITHFKILEAMRGLTGHMATEHSWEDWDTRMTQYASELGSESIYLKQLEQLREKFIELGAPIKNSSGEDLVFVAKTRDPNALPGKQHRIIIDEKILNHLNPEKLKDLLIAAYKAADKNSNSHGLTQYIWEGRANAYRNALHDLGVEIKIQTENDLFSDSEDIPTFTVQRP